MPPTDAPKTHTSQLPTVPTRWENKIEIIHGVILPSCSTSGLLTVLTTDGVVMQFGERCLITRTKEGYDISRRLIAYNVDLIVRVKYLDGTAPGTDGNSIKGHINGSQKIQAYKIVDDSDPAVSKEGGFCYCQREEVWRMRYGLNHRGPSTLCQRREGNDIYPFHAPIRSWTTYCQKLPYEPFLGPLINASTVYNPSVRTPSGWPYGHAPEDTVLQNSAHVMQALERYCKGSNSSNLKKVGSAGYTDLMGMAMLNAHTITRDDAEVLDVVTKATGAMSTGYLERSVEGLKTMLQLAEDELEGRDDKRQLKKQNKWQRGRPWERCLAMLLCQRREEQRREKGRMMMRGVVGRRERVWLSLVRKLNYRL